MSDHVLITCEHGGNDVPPEYARLFHGQRTVLDSHRGHDPGALELARCFQDRLRTALFFSTTTRLLVEINRSVGHKSLYSEFTRDLDPEQRQLIADAYYTPYRRQVEQWIADILRGPKPQTKKPPTKLLRAKHPDANRVLHVAMHSFTPVLNGQVRNADIGLLYDPARQLEKRLCLAWQATLRARRPDLVVRRNYPYLGTADGFPNRLRKCFADETYASIELEVNQKWPLTRQADWPTLQSDLIDTFEQARTDIDHTD